LLAFINGNFTLYRISIKFLKKGYKYPIREHSNTQQSQQ